MHKVQVPAERVTSLEFSPDGTSLAAACWGGTISLYHKQERTSADTAVEHTTAHPQAAEAALPHSLGVQQNVAGTAGSVPGSYEAALDTAAGQGVNGSAAAAGGAATQELMKEQGSTEAPAGISAAPSTSAQHVAPGVHTDGALLQPSTEQAVESGAQINKEAQTDIPHRYASNTTELQQGAGVAAEGHGIDTNVLLGLDAMHMPHAAQEACAAASDHHSEHGTLAGGRNAAADGFPLAPALDTAQEEPRLAAIDHGAGGRGGWRIGPHLLSGQAIKPGTTSPLLLQWTGNTVLMIVRPGGAMQELRLQGSMLVRQSVKCNVNTSPLECLPDLG